MPLSDIVYANVSNTKAIYFNFATATAMAAARLIPLPRAQLSGRSRTAPEQSTRRWSTSFPSVLGTSCHPVPDRSKARRLKVFDIDQSIQNAALQFQKPGANPFAAPALKGRLANIPSRGKGSLV
jgi:hypothetical protein